MSLFSGITTRDVLAVLIVGAALVFNGISLITGKPLDPTTVGLAGVVVGYYFRSPNEAGREEPLGEPATGEDDE